MLPEMWKVTRKAVGTSISYFNQRVVCERRAVQVRPFRRETKKGPGDKLLALRMIFQQTLTSHSLRSSHDLLLGELSLVLGVDAEVLDALELLLLNRLHLESVVLQLLAHALALFQVVQAVLLAHLAVLFNLVSKAQQQLTTTLPLT